MNLLKFSLLCLSISLYNTSSFAITGTDIAKKIYNSNREADSIQSTKMTLTDKRNNKRIRTFISFSKDNNKYDSETLIVFTLPKKIKKTGMLTKNKGEGKANQWLYLPALKKTRRIASGKKTGRFVGSDLLYEDLEDREVKLDHHKLLKREKIGKVNYYVIESKRKKKSSSIYTKVIAWVNPKTWMVKKADFYMKKKTPLKTIYVEKFKKIGKSWRAIKTKIVNHKIKHSTLLEVRNTRFRNNLKSQFFNKSILENQSKIKKYLK